MAKVSNKLPSEEAVQEKLDAVNLDLVELKKVLGGPRRILRLVINDKSAPVGHSQCVAATRLIREYFPDILEDYDLEVSSPGIGRELKTEKDFAIFKGKLVEVIFADQSLEPQEGILVERDSVKLTISLDGVNVSFSNDTIKKVKLALQKIDQAEAIDLEISEEDF
jgi:ribosome maturation factor RimP